MKNRQAPKKRSFEQLLPRIGLLLTFPLFVSIFSLVAAEELKPEGFSIALGLISLLSLLAAVTECTGAVVLPFGLGCCILLLLQVSLMLAVLLVSSSPQPIFANKEAAQRPSLQRQNAALDLSASAAQTQPAHTAADEDIFTVQPVASSASISASVQKPSDSFQLKDRSTLSVILACADESQYAVKTALKVVERTPPEILEEVLLVDDGSSEKIEDTFDRAGIGSEARAQKRIRIIRHDSTQGLMIAKKTGGDNAKGDIFVFFDCHVSPQPNWHEELRKLIIQNPKRMIVPAITDLDLDTWEEKAQSAVNTKTYLTWSADFDWFDDASPEVPVMSGGLLALSAFWWNATGGYDKEMHGWGGENLDQSLRSWLCGGEIMKAMTSRVAHMWRTGDARTHAHYHGTGSVATNKNRVVAAWFGPFAALYYRTFGGANLRGSLDVSNIRAVQERMKCKSMVHFLHHFRDVYIEGGVIPLRVFQLREKRTGLCLSRSWGISLQPCGASGENGDQTQLFHWANRRDSHKCCSGIRAFNTDQCFDYVDKSGVHLYLCDVTGGNLNQQYRYDASTGQISHKDGRCLASIEGSPPNLVSCASLKDGSGQWEEVAPFEPLETRIYREELRKENLKDPWFLEETDVFTASS